MWKCKLGHDVVDVIDVYYQIGGNEVEFVCICTDCDDAFELPLGLVALDG
jgi:hypothetical protein